MVFIFLSNYEPKWPFKFYLHYPWFFAQDSMHCLFKLSLNVTIYSQQFSIYWLKVVNNKWETKTTNSCVRIERKIRIDFFDQSSILRMHYIRWKFIEEIEIKMINNKFEHMTSTSFTKNNRQRDLLSTTWISLCNLIQFRNNDWHLIKQSHRRQRLIEIYIYRMQPIYLAIISFTIQLIYLRGIKKIDFLSNSDAAYHEKGAILFDETREQ